MTSWTNPQFYDGVQRSALLREMQHNINVDARNAERQRQQQAARKAAPTKQRNIYVGSNVGIPEDRLQYNTALTVYLSESNVFSTMRNEFDLSKDDRITRYLSNVYGPETFGKQLQELQDDLIRDAANDILKKSKYYYSENEEEETTVLVYGNATTTKIPVFDFLSLINQHYQGLIFWTIATRRLVMMPGRNILTYGDDKPLSFERAFYKTLHCVSTAPWSVVGSGFHDSVKFVVNGVMDDTESEVCKITKMGLEMLSSSSQDKAKFQNDDIDGTRLIAGKFQNDDIDGTRLIAWLMFTPERRSKYLLSKRSDAVYWNTFGFYLSNYEKIRSDNPQVFCIEFERDACFRVALKLNFNGSTNQDARELLRLDRKKNRGIKISSWVDRDFLANKDKKKPPASTRTKVDRDWGEAQFRIYDDDTQIAGVSTTAAKKRKIERYIASRPSRAKGDNRLMIQKILFPL